MIYDCFTFYNEIDILKMRLEELYPVVDRFIIVEMDRTFQGDNKPSYYELHKKEFEKWADKISVTLIESPESWFYNQTWEREYYQRNAIGTVLEKIGPSPDDIILISDADEIPRRSIITKLDPEPIQSIALDTFYYGINISGGHCHTIRAVRWSDFTTAQQIRTLDPPPNIVYDGGWHFSYLGDAEHIANKFKAFAHSELNRPDTTDPAILQARMEAHGDLWGDGHQYEVVEIDDTWPEAVKRDRGYWSKYEW